MFREAFARRRALIPAALFYEWRPIEGQKAKQPFAIARQDEKPMGLAGIWEGWRGEGGEVIRSFAVNYATGKPTDKAAFYFQQPRAVATLF